MSLSSFPLAAPLSLLGAAVLGFAGVAADRYAQRLLKPRRLFGYPTCAFVEAALTSACLLASVIGFFALPHQPGELRSIGLAWASGALLCRATVDRSRWLGRE